MTDVTTAVLFHHVSISWQARAVAWRELRVRLLARFADILRHQSTTRCALTVQGLPCKSWLGEDECVGSGQENIFQSEVVISGKNARSLDSARDDSAGNLWAYVGMLVAIEFKSDVSRNLEADALL